MVPHVVEKYNKESWKGQYLLEEEDAIFDRTGRIQQRWWSLFVRSRKKLGNAVALDKILVDGVNSNSWFSLSSQFLSSNPLKSNSLIAKLPTYSSFQLWAFILDYILRPMLTLIGSFEYLHPTFLLNSEEQITLN
jgi:hypothetical protein